MSTEYYALRSPFTGITMTEEDGTITIRLTARDGQDAEIRASSGLDAVLLISLADRDERVAHRSCTATMAHYLPDAMQVISEYGELTTIGDLRRGTAP